MYMLLRTIVQQYGTLMIMAFFVARNNQILFTKSAVYRISTANIVVHVHTQNNSIKYSVGRKIVEGRGLHTTNFLVIF